MTLALQNYFKKYKKVPTHVQTYCFWESQTKIEQPLKRRVAEHPRDPFNKFLEILDTESIFFKTHEMEIWYFPIQPKESLPPSHPPTPPYHPLCRGGKTAGPDRRNCHQGILGGGGELSVSPIGLSRPLAYNWALQLN